MDLGLWVNVTKNENDDEMYWRILEFMPNKPLHSNTFETRQGTHIHLTYRPVSQGLKFWMNLDDCEYIF